MPQSLLFEIKLIKDAGRYYGQASVALHILLYLHQSFPPIHLYLIKAASGTLWPKVTVSKQFFNTEDLISQNSLKQTAVNTLKGPKRQTPAPPAQVV